jgi:hypothetical protein
MRNIIPFLFFSVQAFTQNPVPYKFGYEGIEIIAKTKADSTIIYSHHGAKPTIRNEVGQSIIQLYTKGLLKNGPLIVSIYSAIVKGTVSIVRRGKLISIKFTWRTVTWSSGLVEEYRPKRKGK